jgi:hypothetical protein
LVPAGTSGASVMFVTNTGGFITRLFTIAQGAAPRVDDIPSLTSASEALAVDGTGARTIFGGEMPGVRRVRETTSGWSREDAAAVPAGELAMLSDARSIDETHAFAAYMHVNDGLPRLATREGACWRVSQLGTMRVASMSMDTDAMNRPWVAWLTNTGTSLPTLALAGPNGATYAPWTGATADGLSYWDRPVVLAGGLTGTSPFPALATQRVDGLHVVTADSGTAVWTDRVVPGAARAIESSNCPAGGFAFGIPNPCQGLQTCTRRTVGARQGFGLVRTASGRSYAGWVEVDTQTSYNVFAAGPGCFVAAASPTADDDDEIAAVAPYCMCNVTPTATAGTGAIVVARVVNGATPMEAMRRFRLEGPADQLGVAVNGFSMAARGDKLLVVASVGTVSSTDLRYFEIDSAGLP